MIRPAIHADFKQLGQLIENHAAYEGAPLSEPVDLERLRKLVLDEPPRIFLWVVEQDGAIGGYMSATIDCSTWHAAPFVYLDCLYLEPEMRGQGTGRNLIATLAAFAHERGIGWIEWQTPPDNQAGIAFYRCMGANERVKQRFSLDVRSRMTALAQL